MKTILIILPFCILLSYCTNEKKEVVSNEIIVEESSMEESLEEAKKNQLVLMNKKSFDFTCIGECDERSLYEGNYGKYRNLEPFNIKKTISDSLISIEFTFIAECCLEFFGDVNHSKKILELSYRAEGSPCDCLCEYDYKFEIYLNSDFSIIKLNGKSI
ncbi:MAG: hypothetical protein A2W91_00275 [Bacteroidetes bacterium GWF2_38_335]|nr:MAG: hypothetical protein A2W91_00275 [Bacteroidetes bacterium GWF2_38_335]OFY78269.1 MAG: hypothetical protein A2281_03655 [Bacteroidetes bacterium RIFOXYA12_FULL_38_20]HBS87537.1 hypothetical protein [Bacteroidales bacterium]